MDLASISFQFLITLEKSRTTEGLIRTHSTITDTSVPYTAMTRPDSRAMGNDRSDRGI